MAGQPGPSPAATEKSKNTAVKLSGLVRFVDAFCSDLKPNYVRFREVIRILDVDLDQLASGDMLLTSSEYTNAYQKDVAGSCGRAREQFGVNGSVIAGLLDAK